MKKRMAWVLAGVLPLAFLALFFLWPVFSLVARGFQDESGWTLDAVGHTLASARTVRIIRQTFTLAVLGTVFSTLLGLPGAYVLYRLRFRGQRALRAIVTIPFVLPSVVVGVAFRSLLNSTGPLGWLGLDGTPTAVVAAMVFFNYSLVVRTVGALWSRLDERTVQAARTLGATPARAFVTITLPALAPAIGSAASLVFLFCASAFGIVLVLGGSRIGTVETEIWYQTTTMLNLSAAAALSIVQLVFVSASLLLASVVRRRQQRALASRATVSQQQLRSSDAPVVAVTLLVIGVLVLVPLGTLVYRSFVVRGGGLGLANYANLATNASGALSVSVWAALCNSLIIGLCACALALILGWLVAYVLSRSPITRAGRTTITLLDSAFMLPLGISAVTVGFGFLITLNRPPLDLRSSWVLIPIAQALVALPLVVRTLLPTWRSIDPKLRQAAATLGASDSRILATVDLPLTARSIGLAAGFAFATSLGEFGATSFLSRPDRPTLPVVVYRLISRPGAENFGTALAAAVVLAVVTATVMSIAEALGGKETHGW
ncbi:MAG: iron ABC transporter permease [Propionibacteriaceae bacterium]|jgi:thiamine transport system permease protein|nr:iron ABC transporter permease [Propionibacteriaceae bacterium]